MRRRAAHASFVLRGSLDSMFETGGTRDAAQVAFFLVLSFPALLLLVVWAFSALLGDDSVRASIVDAIVSVLPLEEGAARSDVERLLDEVAAGAGALGWIGVLTLVYSSSGAMRGRVSLGVSPDPPRRIANFPRHSLPNRRRVGTWRAEPWGAGSLA
jgi:uncharacterized BrkB/YihY/UPF0761 family membrane protein